MKAFPAVFSLEGEVALISGGGTGIGRAIAECMHAAGATVVLVGRREANLQEAVAALGERAHYRVHDVTEFDRAPALVQELTDAIGAPTCLVNNAGAHLKKDAVLTSTDEFQQILDIHLLGAHALTTAVAPGMIERRHGSILFTASMASIFGIPKVIAYSAAKTAMVGMVKALSTELSPAGVRVNAIAPGWIETDMMSKALDADPVRRDKILGRTPMGTFGQVHDIGWAAVYLVSPAAAFVTGVTLPVDGGASIGF